MRKNQFPPEYLKMWINIYYSEPWSPITDQFNDLECKMNQYIIHLKLGAFKTKPQPPLALGPGHRVPLPSVDSTSSWHTGCVCDNTGSGPCPTFGFTGTPFDTPFFGDWQMDRFFSVMNYFLNVIHIFEYILYL